MRDVHKTYTVRLPDYLIADPVRAKSHLEQLASGLLARVDAYFESDDNGGPLQAPDGTYLVHGPDWTATEYLTAALAHEGRLTVVSVQEAPGRGWRSSQ